MYNKRLQGWMKYLDFILLDLLCLHGGFILAYWLKDGFSRLPYSKYAYGIISVIMSMIALLTAILINGNKDIMRRGPFAELGATIRQVMISLVCLTLSLFALQKGALYSRIILAHTFMFYAILSYGTRLLYKRVRAKIFTNHMKMLVVVSESEANGILETLLKSRYVGIEAEITGVVVVDRDLKGRKLHGIDVVADGDEVIDWVKGCWVDEVFIALPDDSKRLSSLVSAFEDMGIAVHISLQHMYRMAGGSTMMETIGGCSVLTDSLNISDPAMLLVKRLFDLLGGFVGVLIMCVLAVFVIPFQQAASRGPVFFCQERIGRNGKRFKMYKFRSMCMDAEAKKAALMEKNRIGDGMMFKLDWDPRIIGNRELPDGTRKTGIGEFIRRTSIDEFPQFLNVLKGDMSLVGTRPPTVDEWEKYDIHHRARMAMKPGITGMWQVSGRSDITDFEKVVELDRYYITRWSLALDLKILFKTVGVVLKHKGAM